MSRTKINAFQAEMLVNYMECNVDFSKGKLTPTFTKRDREKQWEQLTNMLNAQGGSCKNVSKWMKTWSDMKKNTKKHADLLKKRSATSEGRRSVDPLSALEERVIWIIGQQATDGNGMPESKVNSPPTSTNPFASLDQKHTEEVAAAPHNTSPQHITETILQNETSISNISIEETWTQNSDSTPCEPSHIPKHPKRRRTDLSLEAEHAQQIIHSQNQNAAAVMEVASGLRDVAAANRGIEASINNFAVANTDMKEAIQNFTSVGRGIEAALNNIAAAIASLKPGESMTVKNLPQVLLDSNPTDTAIVVDGKVIPAHQKVLAESSPIISSQLKLSTWKKLEMPNLNFETAEKLVNFIYTKKVPNFQDMEKDSVYKLLEASETYRIDMLKKHTLDFIASNLDVSNAIDVLLMADKMSYSSLKTRVSSFIANNKELFQKSSFARLGNRSDLMAELLGRMCL